MALHLKHIKEWNALEISLNGRNSGKVSADYYQFLEQIPENEKHHVSQYAIMIPDKYLKSYLEKFEWITTTNQTIKSMLGTEEIILPNTDYELKHLDKMKLKPFPYQEVAAQFILSEQTGIVGDEVGLGKVRQIIIICFAVQVGNCLRL